MWTTNVGLNVYIEKYIYRIKMKFYNVIVMVFLIIIVFIYIFCKWNGFFQIL